MTCIIGHRDGWMVADRRATFHDTRVSSFRPEKIVRARDALLALEGMAGVVWRMAPAVWSATPVHEFARLISEHGEDQVSGIAVWRGDVWTVQGCGEMRRVDRADYWCTGSGQELAHGYIAGAVAHDRRVGTLLAVEAIGFASQWNLQCGDGVQVERL